MRTRKFFTLVLAISLLVCGLNMFFISSKAQSNEETVYIAMQQDIPNFNIFDLASNTVWKDYVIGKFAFESLSGLDPEGNIFPQLAEYWAFWEPNLTVVIVLRKGVRFHDYAVSGEEMTADDVVFSYLSQRHGTIHSGPIRDAFDADGDGNAQMEEVDGTIDYDGDGIFEGVTKISTYTVRMVMAKPYGQFFLTTLGIPIIPEHIWSSHVDAQGRLDTLWNNDPVATIATGPFYYKAGQQDVYRIMERFEDYWGKEETAPSGHRLYPGHIKQIYYRLYSSLDEAILALKSGQVDHLPWTITPAYVQDLTDDPNVDLKFVSDNGYFYLGFNQKREPMNHLAFRRAVSHAIDKDTIVNMYLEGYGMVGSSVEPPFWLHWFNSSVEFYSYDMTSAANALVAGGFTGVGSSLRMPDGRPVPPLVIMTPPEDYDPVRAKTGEMIAKNLRSLGMDAVAMPLQFDELVGKMNAFDYDMIIIGWSLSSDPIGNVFDILGPMSSQNYFGFWSSTNENPYYSSFGGVSTLADAETQYLADLTHEHGVRARQTFDRSEQIKWTKAGQGTISFAVPVNVLYYRVNVYGVSARWETDTWINFLGELLNVYTMGELAPTGEPPSTGDQITAMLYAPDKVNVGLDTMASVLVLDDAGMPLSGASVTLFASPWVTLTPPNGISNATGIFEFTINAPEEGYIYLSATATFGGNSFADSKILKAVKSTPNILYLSVAPDSVFLRAGESTTLSLKVVDGLGNPVEGATVILDEGLMGYGTVDSPTLLTDLTGQATMAYYAPTDLSEALNRHLKVRLSLHASKIGYHDSNTNTATQYITIYNSLPSDWRFVVVESVTDYAMDSMGNTSTITLFAHDSLGAPLAFEYVNIAYTNIQNLSNPVTTTVADITGHATFDVTFKNGIDTTATRISMKNGPFPNSVGCSVTLLFKGVTVPGTPIYGGVINFNTTPILDPNLGGFLDATVNLYDIDGNVPVGDIRTTIVVGEPDLGTPAWLYTTDPWIYSSIWDYAGIQSETSWDSSSIISGGYFLSDLMSDAEIDQLNGGLYTSWQSLEDDWWTFVDHSNMRGVTIANGVGYFTVAAADPLLQDSVPHVLVVPNGKMGFYVAPDFSNFYWVLQGQTTLSSEFVTRRAMSIISPHMTVERPVMKSLGSNSTSNVDVIVYDQDNNPVGGVGVDVYVHVYGQRPFFDVDPVPVTNGAGNTNTTVRARTQDTTGIPLHNPAKQPLYAKPYRFGYAAVIASTEIFNVPVQLFLELDHAKRLDSINPTTAVTATVSDEYGTPMMNLPVSFSSNNGTLTPENDITDSQGKATVQFEFLVSVGFQIATITACTLKEGYYSACASSKVEGYAYNTPSTIDVTSVPYSGHVSTDGSVVIEGNATDPEGVDTIVLVLNNTTSVDATGIGGHFLHEYTGLDNGTHVVEVKVTDNQGGTTSTWVIFTVDIPGPPAPQPPTGSITIDEGDEYATSTSVTLTLTYSGGSSTVSQVRYSNDGVWDTENWETPTSTRSWTLESGDGVKTVYYQIENDDGLLSPTYSDDIILDTEKPDVVQVQPEDGSKDIEVTTTITVTFTEAMDESSTESAFSLLTDYGEVLGAIDWSLNSRKLTFTPDIELKKDSEYRVVIASSAQDLAGNSLEIDKEFSFETVRAEETSFLEEYWWIVPLIVIAVLVVILVLWGFRKKPEVQDEVLETEESAP